MSSSSPVHSGLLDDHLDVVRRRTERSSARGCGSCSASRRILLPIEAHHAWRPRNRRRPDGCPASMTPQGLGSGAMGPLPFAADDAVDHGRDTAAARVRRRPLPSKKNRALVQVEHHPPAGIVAVPVARSARRSACRRNKRARSSSAERTAATGAGRCFNDPLGRAHPGVLEPGLGRRGGELIATAVRRALGVMRQPVLVGVDADQVLQRAGQADLLVGLQLGHVDQHVGVHRRAAEQVLVACSRRVACSSRPCRRTRRRAGPALVADELTGVVEVHVRVAGRVPGEFVLSRSRRRPRAIPPGAGRAARSRRRESQRCSVGSESSRPQYCRSVANDESVCGASQMMIAAAPVELLGDPARDGLDDGSGG